MRKFVFGLSDGQAFSLVMYIVAIGGLFFVYRNKEKLIKDIDTL